LWNDRAEWTFAAYDLDRRNVVEQLSGGPPPTFGIAGDIESKGIELNGAIRPVNGLKLWGNIAFTHARFGSDILADSTGGPALMVMGNAPPNVAPIIANAGASYRFEPVSWPTPWPVETGTSARHVDKRYITSYNDVYMDEYTVFDAYMFIDFERPGGRRTSTGPGFRSGREISPTKCTRILLILALSNNSIWERRAALKQRFPSSGKGLATEVR
jgi:iron complex outermembrane recepter protein